MTCCARAIGVTHVSVALCYLPASRGRGMVGNDGWDGPLTQACP
jgi:hypothetical protein